MGGDDGEAMVTLREQLAIFVPAIQRKRCCSRPTRCNPVQHVPNAKCCNPEQHLAIRAACCNPVQHVATQSSILQSVLHVASQRKRCCSRPFRSHAHSSSPAHRAAGGGTCMLASLVGGGRERERERESVCVCECVRACVWACVGRVGGWAIAESTGISPRCAKAAMRLNG